MKKFTRYDSHMLEIFSDPVKWASHHLSGAEARWYQEEILRHPHHRKVLRCGRRIGKTWSMIAHMLWVSFTGNGGKKPHGAICIVATPYDTQARLIYDELMKTISKNPTLMQSLKSTTKNPYFIEFKNGSVIKLFTAGTRSGSEGGSLRGQAADWIYMDEVDYMSDKDFEAIFAIALADPDNIGVIVASTPTGRRGMFYKLCTEMKFTNYNEDGKVVPITYDRDTGRFNDEDYVRTTAAGWAEFYFPTMVNPGWNPRMEKELKGMYTQVAYEHEVLAEFGTEMVGVFNKDFIDEAASIAYSYLSRPTYDFPICIGIDWDKFGTATQIVVVQWDPTEERRSQGNIHFRPDIRGRFRVINRVEIPKGEYTYDLAVQKVIELDQIYNPRFIFPDRGAGEYQIEKLHQALGSKVKGIHLGSSHEIVDPITKEVDKKPMKPFMVNQATLLLERGMLRIPHKEVDETIFRQMTNYTVVRISPKTLEPTYSSEDEHALDAMMLALLAFIIEMPEIAATIHEVVVARTMANTSVRFVDPLASIYKGDGLAGRGSDLPKYMKEWDEIGTPPPRKVSVGWSKRGKNDFSWGARGSTGKRPPGRNSW